MKRTFIVALVMCVSACASHPQNPTVSDPTGSIANATAQAAGDPAAGSSERVYKDDYDRLLVRAPRRESKVLLLGKKKR